MRPAPNNTLERYRLVELEFAASPHRSFVGTNGGIFGVRSRDRTVELRIIASDGLSGDHSEAGGGWEHVSVSTPKRCPTWEEMCWVKDLFWGEEESVMQLHPPRSEWVDNHPYCLHLWRPLDAEIPRPPQALVGVKGMSYETARRMKGSFRLR